MRNTGSATPLRAREVIEKAMRLGLDRKEAKREYLRMSALQWWGNSIYSCSVDDDTDLNWFGPDVRIIHLSIHRRDRQPVTDWRDCQQIKNDICGEEFEGMMLYPCEARVIDCANEFHIFVMVQRATGLPIVIPCGWRMGKKQSESGDGAVQRPHEAKL